MATRRKPKQRIRSETSFPLFGTNDVAALLSVHPKHVYRLLKRGLPAHRMGSEWRFDRNEVLAWALGEGDALGSGPVPREPPPLIAANGDVCVELVLRVAAERFGAVYGFVQTDRRAALSLLEADRVIAGGVHGEHTEAGPDYVRIHVVRRQVGLAHRARRKLRKPADVEGQRLASRPSTAGVRAHLDAVLGESGLDSVHTHESAVLHASHRDVVLAVLAGEADVGLTSVAWAHKAGLECLAIAEEDYYLCMKASALATEAGRSLVRALESPEVKGLLAATAGYDVSRIGTLLV